MLLVVFMIYEAHVIEEDSHQTQLIQYFSWFLLPTSFFMTFSFYFIFSLVFTKSSVFFDSENKRDLTYSKNINDFKYHLSGYISSIVTMFLYI